MPPLSAIICTDCWTKSKALYSLVLASAALCYRKMHFLYHFPSPNTHTHTRIHLCMFILTWKCACVRAVAVASHSSLVVWWVYWLGGYRLFYHIVQNTSVFSIQFYVLFSSLFRFRLTWTTDFSSLHIPHHSFCFFASLCFCVSLCSIRNKCFTCHGAISLCSHVYIVVFSECTVIWHLFHCLTHGCLFLISCQGIYFCFYP